MNRSRNPTRAIQTLFSLYMLIICSCSCKTEPEVLVFDPSGNYPEFPLSFNDVADISYIKLGGEKEGIFFSTIWDTGIYIDHLHERIFVGKFNIGVLEFDIHGKFIRKLGRLGRGPGEYITTFFYVLPEQEKVGIYDEGKNQFLIYNYLGDFLENESISVKLKPLFLSFLVQNNYLVVYSPHSESFYEGEDRTVHYSEKTLDLIPLDAQGDATIKDIHYEKPLVMPNDWGADSRKIMLPGQLFPSFSGLMMSTYRSDTTFVIDKSFRWRPFLVNARHNGVDEGCLYPVAETRDYLFLSQQNNVQNRKMYYFAIDKNIKQAYKITTDESSPLPGYLQGKIQLESGGLTKNPEYRFWELYPEELKGTCYNHLPRELKSLVDQCNEDSNPILMLIRFKDV